MDEEKKNSPTRNNNNEINFILNAHLTSNNKIYTWYCNAVVHKYMHIIAMMMMMIALRNGKILDGGPLPAISISMKFVLKMNQRYCIYSRIDEMERKFIEILRIN